MKLNVKIQLLKSYSQLEIYALFTMPALDVFPLVCLACSSESGPACIKKLVMYGELPRTHTRIHTRTHSSHADWQKHPGLPSFPAAITLPTSIVPGVGGWVSVLKLTFIGWFQVGSHRRSKILFFLLGEICCFLRRFFMAVDKYWREWLKKSLYEATGGTAVSCKHVGETALGSRELFKVVGLY